MGRARYAEIEQPRLWRKDVLPTDRGGRPLVRSPALRAAYSGSAGAACHAGARRIPERIFDALTHGELLGGKAGIVLDSQRPALDDPELTVRHVDLKAWMSQFYPGDRPGFLFDGIERAVHPAVSVDTLNILLADREAAKSQLAELALVHETLRTAHEALAKEHATRAANDEQAREPGLRSETTYLNIIGGLLTLLLGNSPSGAAYSSFRSMDAVVSALIAHHEGRPGLSERTLWSKLAQARRHLEASR